MRTRLLAVAVAAALLLAALVAGCAPEEEEVDEPVVDEEPSGPQQGGELVVGLASTGDVLDPHVSGARRSHSITRHIFDPLVARDFEDQSFQAGLATSWEWNDDHTSLTMQLREGVEFHDGTPFNAEAVKYSLDRIVDPETMSKAAVDYIGPYESTEVLDEYEVRVNYERTVSSRAILNAMSQVHLAPVSPTAAEEMGVDDFGRNPVGTGPFKFVEWTAADTVILERNPDYEWAPDIYDLDGPAYLDELVFEEIPEGSTRVAALEGGEVHVILEAAEESVPALQEDPNFGTESAENPGGPAIMWMNTEDEIFEDIRVRQAFNYGFDQQEMVDTVFDGLMPPAYGPLAEATWGYCPEVEDKYQYDPDRAEELLDEAGWERTDGGVREKDGEPLEVDILDLQDARRMEFFQARMSDIGVQINPRVVTSDYLWEVTRDADDYQMGSTWFGYTDPHVLNQLYHSSNVGTGFAISRYKCSELDEMLEQAVSIPDEDERYEMYCDIQLRIMDLALMVPFHGRKEHSAFQDNVQGYRLEFEHPILHEVYFDPPQ